MPARDRVKIAPGSAAGPLGPGVGLIQIACALELLRGNPALGIGVEGENATILDPGDLLRFVFLGPKR